MSKKKNIILSVPFVLSSCTPNVSVPIVAHRGYHEKEVENTYGAFVEAGKRNVIGIETDIRFTKDGGIVCNHDGKLFGTDVDIATSTYEEIMNTRIGGTDDNPTYPCSFESYLNVCVESNKIPYIEWKIDPSEDQINQVFSIIQSKMSVNDVVFISFYKNAILKLDARRENGYTYETYVLCSETSKAEECIREGIAIDIQYDILTDSIISMARERKQKIVVWTVDEAKTANELYRRGVDIVTSNKLEQSN